MSWLPICKLFLVTALAGAVSGAVDALQSGDLHSINYDHLVKSAIAGSLLYLAGILKENPVTKAAKKQEFAKSLETLNKATEIVDEQKSE